MEPPPAALARNTRVTAEDRRSGGRLSARRLSDRIFHDVFPRLARAVAAVAPAAPLADVRDAALVLLYRQLFSLWAKAPDLSSSLPSAACGEGKGGGAAGLPPWGCGLPHVESTPHLAETSLGDGVMADVIDSLSFEQTPEGRSPIDYSALSVQQLGSIYERLLELELVRDGADAVVRPDPVARRTSGSYYTPDDLVALTIRETVGPLAAERMAAFRANADPRLDPAERLLDLKVCDPAMGAGHFLVSLVDDLADRIMAAMKEAESAAASAAAAGRYVSPLRARIAAVRSAIMREAAAGGFATDPARLDDRSIVRRMVAARCVYGVDKNPMAVELAKAALQLHTFIPGAPPVFLDHHLRCGDSLFGLWVRNGMEKAKVQGRAHLLKDAMARAADTAAAMQALDDLNDAVTDTRRLADAFAAVRKMTAPLDAQLSLLHAFDWLGGEDEEAARRLIAEERFLNWETAFPDVWPGPVGWIKAVDALQIDRGVRPAATRHGRPRSVAAGQRRAASRNAEAALTHPTGPGQLGGFDAVIGNPPWDRMKLQQVEWFAARRRDIAFAPRAADRARMIAALTASGDPLTGDFASASARAEAAMRMARTCGDYPLMSGGDVNLYSLFVERAMALVKPHGLVGLLVPSGIASDKTAAKFFHGVATGGRLRALYDFENRRTRFGAEPFFPDVDGRFKFCAFVASPEPLATPARCAFFLQDVSEIADPQRCFPLTAEDFARVNPNTGTAPVFRTRRDADLTIGIYGRVPVLADRSANMDARIRFAVAANASPPPCGAGRGVGVARCGTAVPYCTTPHPIPPAQGGRESRVAASDPDFALAVTGPAVTSAQVRAWPVRYMTMFHMTNDSHLFRTRAELIEKEKAHPIGGNCWQSEHGLWLPLYEGKMAQAYDHRAASVAVNAQNRHRPAQPEPATLMQHKDPSWLPEPQYWVAASRCGWRPDETWVLGFKEITSPTNERTFVAALFPAMAFGNKIPLLRLPPQRVGGCETIEALHPEGARSAVLSLWKDEDGRGFGARSRAQPTCSEAEAAGGSFGRRNRVTSVETRPAGAPHDEGEIASQPLRVGAHLLCANLNSIVFDFVARQKIPGQTLNRFIIEQLPVIPPDDYGRRFGDITAAQIITGAVLELTYTSHDMAPFAADMGFVDAAGAVGPPFAWDGERRVELRAQLDAVFFHLYGVTGRDDVRHIYSTFPILERVETARHGRYLSRDVCLAWIDALERGTPSAR